MTKHFLFVCNVSNIVAGLPDSRRDHAEVMARFANDMLKKMTHVTRELGTTLGPGTSTLRVRIGVSACFPIKYIFASVNVPQRCIYNIIIRS